MHGVRLRGFGAEQVGLVQGWFTDPQTQRWLGGPDWVERMLALAAGPLEEFRGARETGRYRWLAWLGRVPVGYIDCETYDRWAIWDGGPGGSGVTGSLPGPAAGFSYVVDPASRRRGLGTAMIKAMLAAPEVAHVRLFVAGVEPANVGSVGCLSRAGFVPLDPTPDWEGFVYYARYRPDASGPTSRWG